MALPATNDACRSRVTFAPLPNDKPDVFKKSPLVRVNVLVTVNGLFNVTSVPPDVLLMVNVPRVLPAGSNTNVPNVPEFVVTFKTDAELDDNVPPVEVKI